MAYKLYTDKNEEFECTLDIKNASLRDAVTRLVIESENINLVFNGKINNGKCTIPIKKLKGILDENVKGNMKLEVIVEDMYFSPWQSEFVVEEHTSVKVQVAEQKIVSKPSIQISEVKKAVETPVDTRTAQQVVLEQLESKGINKKNYKKRIKEVESIFVEYFENHESQENNRKSIIKETLSNLK